MGLLIVVLLSASYAGQLRRQASLEEQVVEARRWATQEREITEQQGQVADQQRRRVKDPLGRNAALQMNLAQRTNQLQQALLSRYAVQLGQVLEPMGR